MLSQAHCKTCRFWTDAPSDKTRAVTPISLGSNRPVDLGWLSPNGWGGQPVKRTDYFPLVEAIELATGRRVNLSTAMRWCLKGTRGVVLQSWMLGGKRLTNLDAVHRFMETCTKASTHSHAPTPPRTTRHRLKALEQAKRALDREGI